MVVLLENNQFKKNLSPYYDPMLNVSCPLWQQPFWNFHQNKKFKLCKEPFTKKPKIATNVGPCGKMERKKLSEFCLFV
jgi:hypothetical protein